MTQVSEWVCPQCHNPNCEGTHFAPSPGYAPPPQPAAWWPSIAGHCGKCGAPYTVDLVTSGFGPPKFHLTCVCWNVSREDKP